MLLFLRFLTFFPTIHKFFGGVFLIRLKGVMIEYAVQIVKPPEAHCDLLY